MKPVYWIIAFVAGAALASAWHLSREGGADAAAQPAAAEVQTATAAPAASATPTSSPAAPAQPVSAADAPPSEAHVTQWIADTRSPDAAKRSAAINALSNAPRDRALPVLRRVLLNGEPTGDRPLALNSLRELALGQGDADNGIRQAIREVIYHGDDVAFASSAQDALDVVEESEMK